MAGREVFDEEEIKEVVDVLKRKDFFRYGFDKEREGIYKVEEFKFTETGWSKKEL